MGSQVAKKRAAAAVHIPRTSCARARANSRASGRSMAAKKRDSADHKTNYIERQRQPGCADQGKEILPPAHRTRKHRGDAPRALLIAQQRAPGKGHQPQSVKALLVQDGEHIVGLRLARGHQQNRRHAKRPQHQKQIDPAILIEQPARDLARSYDNLDVFMDRSIRETDPPAGGAAAQGSRSRLPHAIPPRSRGAVPAQEPICVSKQGRHRQSRPQGRCG